MTHLRYSLAFVSIAIVTGQSFTSATFMSAPNSWIHMIDLLRWGRYVVRMKAIEFTAELKGDAVLSIPQEAAAQLPRRGHVPVIVLTPEDTDETEWRLGSYEQFLREDPPEDSVYDNLR